MFPYRVTYDETYDTSRAPLMVARPISVRLSEDMLSAMDRYLASPDAAATIRTRTQLIQAALDMWLQADEAARVDSAIIAGYTRFPPDPAEDAEFLRISNRAQQALEDW
jgi:Arc/MetJ-type ribon-helix-helix transcriptional regulator